MDYDLVFNKAVAGYRDHPLQAFDSLIVLSRKQDLLVGLQKRVKKLAVRCILQLGGTVPEQESLDDEDVENMAKDALDHYVLLENRDLIAACYLRLLPEAGFKWVAQPPWRPKVVAFLDNTLDAGIYRAWRIASELAHEKVARLVDAVRGEERLLREATESLTSIQAIAAHRSRIMECLNSKQGQILFRSFLPSSTVHSLGEVYRLLGGYWAERERPGVLDAHASALREIDRLRASLENFGTLYSVELASTLCGRLGSVLEEDFASNKAAQPADVRAEPRRKKYPLHLTGEVVNVGVIVANAGPGHAHNVRLAVVCDENALQFLNPEVEIGGLSPASSQMIEIPAQVIEQGNQISILAQVSWDDFDRTSHSSDMEMSIQAQRADIEWARLRQLAPYSLEPVANEHELVGRHEVVNRLLASAKSPNAGSSIIHGQKRVGKTSIAKALQSLLKGLGYITVYMEAGDYVMPSASATISRLGTKLCQAIVASEGRVRHLHMPDFSQALSPLTDFLDEVNTIVPERRLIVLLDEFDELPTELYVRGTWGDSFFLTLRSITSRPEIGFVLVGGEKIAHIMDYQGDQLNRWAVAQVDYFSRETDWSDYRELVTRPVEDILEFTDDALEALHEYTAGNPYFTKLICQYVFRDGLAKRDCYITRHEVGRAATLANQEAEKNTFQHFWEDGIVELGEKATAKSIRRRKVLIATTDVLRRTTPALGRSIAEHPVVRENPMLESDLREFVSRKVLLGNLAGNFADQSFEFKVRFFHDWLRSRGIQDVISTFADLDAAMQERRFEEQLRVLPSEIQEVSKTWGQYKGQTVSEEKLRAWLDQFVKPSEQRLMFEVVRAVRFYSNAQIRAKLSEAHDIVTRGLLRTKEYRQQKRADILVSYLDRFGKSGGSLARLYAEEAKIYVDNVIERDALPSALRRMEGIGAVVFVDDFIATGDQAGENLLAVQELLKDIAIASEVRFFLVSVVAMGRALKRLQELGSAIKPRFEVRACDLLDENARLFGEYSATFKDSTVRENAKRVAIEYGRALVRDNPLGYGDLGLAVVFEHGCPNGSLPILWAQSGNPRWVPLFRRH